MSRSVRGHLVDITLSCNRTGQCASTFQDTKAGRIVLQGGLVQERVDRLKNVRQVENGREQVFILTGQQLLVQSQHHNRTVSVDLQLDVLHQ